MNLNEPPGRSDITRETNFLKPEISKVSIGHFWGEFPDPITTKFRGDQPDRSLLKKNALEVDGRTALEVHQKTPWSYRLGKRGFTMLSIKGLSSKRKVNHFFEDAGVALLASLTTYQYTVMTQLKSHYSKVTYPT